MPTVKLEKAEVLEYSERSYTGKDGKAKVFKQALVKFGGKVFKIRVGQDCPAFKEGPYKFLDVELSTFGDNLTPSLQIVKVG